MTPTIRQLLEDADQLLTDGESLQALAVQWGEDDSTYNWASQVRALLHQTSYVTRSQNPTANHRP
jgi:hypothetical protein